MSDATTISFRGRLDPVGFIEFAEHRARRLDLGVRFGDVGREAVTVTLVGEPDLIDAFEMACSLGPFDCLVLVVERWGPASTEETE
ncbi:hypothetical protein [Lichenihabitans psoromatis]|uniref:hypothetical protein n=1 Tax=Lichenihabitans psoromatis TaxID=2528642 RepID=UPI0014785E9F|nr:hypothetical protein [Lichenihabitans psoromatis]